MQNKGNRTPIYARIKDDLKQKILSGEFGVAQLLPSEREMCATYGASRMTVRQAINELQSEGFLYKIQGKGTFVSNTKVEQQLAGLSSFSEDMERLGHRPGSRIIAFKSFQADAQIAEKLHIAQGDPILMLKRLRIADEERMSIETTYLNAKLVTGIEMDDSDSFSLYHYLKHTLQIPLVRAVQTIQSTLITGKNAHLLQVPENMLGLLIERVTYTEHDIPVEYVISQYRGDLYKFVIEMKA
ncbi:MAG: GntR family transcriptional regulator [Clostridiales bacterium]|nr:GntR family transcriptional regulator [Clostridiales bacterium]